MARAGVRKEPGDRLHIREHLANERTFLAWIRTGVSILAFGFVVEKFSIYIRYLAANSGVSLPARGQSPTFGVVFILIASLVVLLATARFKITQRQIDRGEYKPSVILDITVSLLIVFVALLMAMFWFRT
ncbi:MAG: YidH family protein [Bacillota bacterium]